MEEKQIYTINQIKMRISPILKEYGVRKATLFGSYSQGKATEKSDRPVDRQRIARAKIRGAD